MRVDAILLTIESTARKILQGKSNKELYILTVNCLVLLPNHHIVTSLNAKLIAFVTDMIISYLVHIYNYYEVNL